MTTHTGVKWVEARNFNPAHTIANCSGPVDQPSQALYCI